MNGYYIVSIDGTGHYSSTKISCKNCCEKHHRNDRDVSIIYYHQMLGAAIVHPENNFEYYNQAPLNHARFDYKVNFLSYTQTNPKCKKVKFSWVSSLEITEDNLYKIMRAGRSRLRIENETFNTLKN